MWGEISDIPKFSYDHDGNYYILNTVFFMNGNNLAYILCFLNSNISKYFFSTNIATSTGVGTIRWLKYKIETLPIPMIKNTTIFEDFVKKIQNQHENSNIISDIELQINKQIYEVLCLSGEEISFIESQ